VDREASHLIKTSGSSKEKFSQTFDYEIKDISKLKNFNQVFDWENSSFYQANTY
tara:strand:+ start:295 stop:456 length:162 start_codon:yes stop_codon:yes gene_type:complete